MADDEGVYDVMRRDVLCVVYDVMCVDYVEKRKSPSRRRVSHGPPAAGTAAAFIMGKHEFSDSEEEVGWTGWRGCGDGVGVISFVTVCVHVRYVHRCVHELSVCLCLVSVYLACVRVQL